MKTSIALLISMTLFSFSAAYADIFGTGNNAFSIEFVTIRNPGNAADTTGDPNPAGTVTRTYRIGKFEISEEMTDKANSESAAVGDPLNIRHDGRGANKPATSISWFNAARFVNWLNTSTGNTPAYKFDDSGNLQLWQPGDAGYDAANFYRNSLTRYFLPSVDEWYKAAYYDPTSGVYYDYPTGSNTAPTAVTSSAAPGTAVYRQTFATGPAEITLAGGLSPYGTMGQGGNVWEWEETDRDLVNGPAFSVRGVRGGSWQNTFSNLAASGRGNGNPVTESRVFGFRVASLPHIVGRHIFYNNSAHDLGTGGASVHDNLAIATDKAALRPGDGRASFANYTSYDRGINGITIDVHGLANAATLSAADFTFRMGNTSDPSQWSVAPSPINDISADVRPGGGVNDSDRITLLWEDGAVMGQWLEVTVHANDNTGLNMEDVFYFGNAAGDSGQGNLPTVVVVDEADRAAARANGRNLLDPAPIDFDFDYNRDGVVNAVDRGIARANPANDASGLQLFIPRAAGPPLPLSAELAAVPEPGTLVLLGIGGLVLAAGVGRRRRRRGQV